ncbi:hypothetical protein DFJ73DRAFT_761506 [Zopfochytrium polystomum]|nr:hypothetical protein DFJ73DRAFT_761506 [Zopfochytrium polystomum]
MPDRATAGWAIARQYERGNGRSGGGFDEGGWVTGTMVGPGSRACEAAAAGGCGGCGFGVGFRLLFKRKCNMRSPRFVARHIAADTTLKLRRIRRKQDAEGGPPCPVRAPTWPAWEAAATGLRCDVHSFGRVPPQIHPNLQK